MSATKKLASVALVIAGLVASVVLGSLTATPDPLIFDTRLTSQNDYQGCAYLYVTGDAGRYWFYCNKIWNINRAFVNAEEDIELLEIPAQNPDPILISVVKDDQDEGWMTVLIYHDEDDDGIFEPGTHDPLVDYVWVLVDA